MKKNMIKKLIQGEYAFGMYLEAELMSGLSLEAAEETLREISQMHHLPRFLRRRAEAEADALREDIDWWAYVARCEEQLAAAQSR